MKQTTKLRKGKGLADGTLALIKRVHEGDKEAREQLVEENMGLVFTVVARFLGRGCDREDLVQIWCRSEALDC